jgi:hypothetical protein
MCELGKFSFFPPMAELGGALEYLVGLQDLVANLQGEAEDEGVEASTDVPGAYLEQPATPPFDNVSEAPEPSPSEIPGEPDELSLEDYGIITEDSDGEDDGDKWMLRFMKGAGKGKGADRDSTCESKAKAATKVPIVPSSSEKSLEAPRPWRNKQQKIGEPSPPPFPPPDFAGGAYVVGAPHGGRPVPQGFPPGMQAPPPPPGYVEPLPYASTRQACLVPPPPPPAVLPSQHVVRPSSKSKVMQNRPPGGSRRNWEKSVSDCQSKK